MKSKLNQILCFALLYGALICLTFQGEGIFALTPRFDWSLFCMVLFFDVAWLWIARKNWQKNRKKAVYAVLRNGEMKHYRIFSMKKAVNGEKVRKII